MGDRFQHARHVFRVAAVLSVALVAFLVARSALIPSDFGVLGYYRAGALDDIGALPIVYAGRDVCLVCHDSYDPAAPPDDGRGKKPAVKASLDPARDNKHFRLSCEACHGPMQKHVDDQEKPVPKVASDNLCLGCHRRLAGRPKIQPQVVPADHKKSGDEKKDACVACHQPHWPKTSGD